MFGRIPAEWRLGSCERDLIESLAFWNRLQRAGTRCARTGQPPQHKDQTMQYRLSKEGITQSIDNAFPLAAVSAAGVAASHVQPEAFRSIAFEDLPSDVLHQLRRDGTRGQLRSESEAQAVYEQLVPAEAKGDTEPFARSPTSGIHFGHEAMEFYQAQATPAVFTWMAESISRLDRSMTAADIAAAEEFTQEIALDASPGTAGSR